MNLSVDIVLAAAIVVGALLFLVRRFSKPSQPSCAPDAKAKPAVIVGSRLAKAMAGGRSTKH